MDRTLQKPKLAKITLNQLKTVFYTTANRDVSGIQATRRWSLFASRWLSDPECFPGQMYLQFNIDWMFA